MSLCPVCPAMFQLAQHTCSRVSLVCALMFTILFKTAPVIALHNIHCICAFIYRMWHAQNSVCQCFLETLLTDHFTLFAHRKPFNMAAIHNSSQQQQYCLKWNSFHTNMSDVFQNMLVNESLVDVTLACEGASIKAHKMILAACSPYFQNLFTTNPCKHPIVILKDVKFNDLKSIIDFIYCGEVSIPQDQLNSLLKTAETLKIKGLADFGEKQLSNSVSLKNNSSSSLPLNYSSINFGKKRKRPRIQYSINNTSAINNNSSHKTYSKNVNNLSVQHKDEVTNGDNVDSSDDEEEEGNNSSKSASIDKSFFVSGVNSPSFKATTNQQQSAVFDNENERDDSEEFEPTKLLEQSMSTPEVRYNLLKS